MAEISGEVILEKLETVRILNLEQHLELKDRILEIKVQTTKTNWSVAQAIIDIASINAWRNKIVWGLIVSNIFIVPILMWLVYAHLKT